MVCCVRQTTWLPKNLLELRKKSMYEMLDLMFCLNNKRLCSRNEIVGFHICRMPMSSFATVVQMSTEAEQEEHILFSSMNVQQQFKETHNQVEMIIRMKNHKKVKVTMASVADVYKNKTIKKLAKKQAENDKISILKLCSSNARKDSKSLRPHRCLNSATVASATVESLKSCCKKPAENHRQMYASDSQVADFSAYWDQTRQSTHEKLLRVNKQAEIVIVKTKNILVRPNVAAKKLMADKQVIARLWTRDTRAEIVYKKVNRFLSEEEALPINMLEELMLLILIGLNQTTSLHQNVIPILIRKIFLSLYTGTFSYELFHNKMAAFDSLDAFTSEFQLYQHVTCILRYYRTETSSRRLSPSKQKKDLEKSDVSLGQRCRNSESQKLKKCSRKKFYYRYLEVEVYLDPQFTDGLRSYFNSKSRSAKQKKDSSIPKKIQHIVAEEEDDLFLDQFDVNFKERLLTRFWKM
ncbi:hypothetical protein L5515_017359 [Caenorhabditis briggsae]|uniref:Uncharacterized protein n=1 Tax=Caenorhabditis briggsae TaxID=6238 RepID=A0AAE9FJA1_CAEBR|nr:hypothetical protein L5515_017359 [Caenorhabditis briggsae]